MNTKYKDVFTQCFLISLLVAVSFVKISYMKIPYWLISLVMIYYTFAYKSTLNQFDTLIQRSLANKQIQYSKVALWVYIPLSLTVKLAFTINYFMESKNSIIDSSIFHILLFGNKKENEQIPIDFSTFTIETILEIFMLISLVVINLSEKNAYNENNIQNNEINFVKLYSEYKQFKTNKFYFYLLQFILLTTVIIFNISLINLPNFIIVCLLIIFCIFCPYEYKYIDNINKVFNVTSFLLLNFHYIKNIPQLRTKYDNIIGVTNFNSTFSIVYFTTFCLSYINSSLIQRYSYTTDPVKESLDTLTENKKTEIKSKGACPLKLLNFVKPLLFQFAPIGYKIILLVWILLHVCVFMFINFLILFFGIYKAKQSFQRFYLIPSFIVSLFYIILQYVYNMSGMFIFENIRVYKLLEVLGIYKYYKFKVSDDYSNVKMLDERTEEKIKGMMTDMIVIILLFVYALAMCVENKRQTRKDSVIAANTEQVRLSNNNNDDVENNPVSAQPFENLPNNNSNYYINFIADKSYILSLMILFICSIIKFDLLHIIYFVSFIILLFVSDSIFKPVWNRVLLLNGFIIIIVLYFWNILALNFLNLEHETNPDNENIFTYLGLKIKKNSIFFVDYWEHIFLYIFGYLHNFFIVSIVNKQNNLLSEDEEEKDQVKNLYKFPEWTRILSCIIVIITMICFSLIRPLSFQGLFLLSFCLLFVIANLFIVSVNKKGIIKTFIYMLILLCIIALISKYCINFSFLINYLKDNFDLEDTSKTNNYFRLSEGNEAFNNIPISNEDNNPHMKYFALQDFGLDSFNLNLKLLVNAFLIIMLKVLYAYDVYSNKEGQYEELNRNENEKELTRTERVFAYFKILMYQIVYLHSTKIMFVVSVFMCLCMESMIGVILFGVMLISLFLELRSGWKYSFFPLIIISIMVIAFIYLCHLHAFKKWMTKDYEWFGLYNPKSDIVFVDLLPYIAVIFVSFLSRISGSFKLYYIEDSTTNYDSDESVKDDNSKDNLLIVEENKEVELTIKENNQPSNENTGNVDQDKVNENKPISDLKSIESPKINTVVLPSDDIIDIKESDKDNTSDIKLDYSDISIYQYEKYEEQIIITLSKIWMKIDYFWYLYGFYVVLITTMLIAFIKVNVLSLIFMAFVGLQSFGAYIRTEYKTEKEEKNKNYLNIIKKSWMNFAVFLAIFTFCQYINYMWFPPSWKIAKPWENFSFFCAKEGKTIYSNNIHYKNTSDFEYCVADWKAWLNIDNYNTKDIFNNFICLFLILITHKYFTDEEIFQRAAFKEEKEKDFTIAENRKKFGDTLKYFLFIYLKSFILFYVIFISIVYSYRFTNLIYGGFLFISFYLLFKDAALSKQKNNLWKYVQYYNYLVLVAFMLFQTPFLPCPVNRDGRSYMGLEECVNEENRLYSSYLLYEYPKNKIDALYMVMVQTIGVLKLDFKLLIVGNLSLFLIYIVALIQQIIFDHPYQGIVDMYINREKQINCKSRAFKIVQDCHLNIHTEYRQIFTQMEILNGKLGRLERRIREYASLWKQTNYVNHNESLFSDDLESMNDVKRKEYKLKEDIDVMLEEMINSNKHYAGLLDFKTVKQKVEQITKDVMAEFEEADKKKASKEEEGEETKNELNLTESENLEERERRLKEEIAIKLKQEIKNNLYASQYIHDKMELYRLKYHGLHIAYKHFEKMVNECENPSDISTFEKELELLKNLFNKNSSYSIPEIKQLPQHLNTNEGNYNTEPNNLLFTKKISIISSNQLKVLSWYEELKKQIRKTIDKDVLIDLISTKKTRLSNLFELIIFSVYTNIEVFIVITFIIHHCVDASVMSMIYPLSYFGYGLIEYPFTNKYYWKLLTVYSLIIIILKLVYQFPFFCGYPFMSIFNIFQDNYCEYYNLSEQDITEGFEFIIGLRKYNGEYSFPKNAGLLSGIIGDIIILCLLLVMRSLLKSKGIWSFVNINKEFMKVPVFENNKLNTSESEEDKPISEIIQENISNNTENVQPNSSNENNFIPVIHIIDNNQPDNNNIIPPQSNNRSNNIHNNNNTDSKWNNISIFFKRLVPELFLEEKFIIYKPGVDYYPLSFATLLVILIYTLFFFGNITGRNSSLNDMLDKQQFSKELVWIILLQIAIIVTDRVIYKMRSINNEFIFEKFKKIENSNPTLLDENKKYNSDSGMFNENLNRNIDDITNSNLALCIKLILHYSLLIGVHILLFFMVPLSTHISFFNSNSLIMLYLLCCIYFYFSSLQIKFGFPLATKGQYFADSTRLSSRIAFKIYRNVPFLYELRAILDWTITRTSLDLFQWFKMEDAYANLYEVKCDMNLRKQRKNGEDRWWLEKVGWGFCSFLVLMIILIGPMILFSSFNPNLVENKVLGGKFIVNLELKNPDTKVTTFSLNLFEVTTLKINNVNNKTQYEYLKNYLISHVDDVEERKVQIAKVVNYSQLDWILSPPAINALLKHLEKKTECYINIEWEFKRQYPQNNKFISGNKINQLGREQIAMLRNIIFSLKTHQKPEKYKLDIKDAFPKVLRLSNKEWKYIKFDPKHKTLHRENTDLEIQLIKENERDIYWKIHQLEVKNLPDSPFFSKNDELTFILINDDVISSFFGFNSDGSIPLSIIGIYATIVYAVGKFVRVFFDKISQRVIYEEMPEPNDLFELCEGVYIYRNQRKLDKENSLYDLLIRIYRSPETLIKITGAKVKYLPSNN